MKEAPPSFPLDRLAEVLSVYWQIRTIDLEYVPVGFGAHHWRVHEEDGSDYFLALHDLGEHPDSGFSRLTHALGTARYLQSVAELDFVLAPLPNQQGELMYRFATGSALAVYPWVNCRPRPALDAPDVGHMLARLHASRRNLPTDVILAENFAIPWRGRLEQALMNLDQPWDTGPCGEPAREQLGLAAKAVRALLAKYDRLAAEAVESRSEWVVTHGEPYGPNLVESDGGQTLLVDWDSALLAPRERDLWELPDAGPALQAYMESAGASPVSARLTLYRAWYYLAETAVYTQRFQQPHGGDLNDATAWENFLFFLPSTSSWPDLERWS